MANELDFFKGFMFRAEDESWFMMPVCNFFGLDYDNQVEKINNDKICQTDTGKFLSETVFGDKRLRLTLRNRGFSRWVQMTSASNIRVELREKFEIFQANIFDYLWNGNESKTAQLEDIRDYVLKINEAIRISHQVKEYIAEQKQHRDLCLITPPNEWTQIKNTLVEEKILPISTGFTKAIVLDLPDDIEQLKRRKHIVQGYIHRAQNTILYQTTTIQEKENPMPEGYKKEMKKLKIKSLEEQVEQIENKILAINKQLN